MKIKRINKILDFIKQNQSIFIIGPRTTGKSFYINDLLPLIGENLSINLLDINLFQRYLLNPTLIKFEIETKLKNTPHLTVFIDEIQKLPILLDTIHLLMETYHERLQFILTGSSARKLKKENVNLLAGRAISMGFTNLTFEEIDFKNNLSDIIQYGLLPKVFLTSNWDIKIELLKSYTGTYLKEEIMQEALVRNVSSFNQFLELAAQINGQCTNYSKLSKQIGISDYTIKEHYKILEDTLLATSIPAWSTSTKKKLQSATKYYFFDNGVLNALRGELRTELRPSSYRFGNLFENLVINEIIKYNQLHRFDYKLSHYRTYTGKEIDLIIQKNNFSKPVAVEIKATSSPNPDELVVLRKFKEENPSSQTAVICTTPTPYSIEGIDILSFPEGIPDLFEKYLE